jgi:hypothetical protein
MAVEFQAQAHLHLSGMQREPSASLPRLGSRLRAKCKYCQKRE